MTPRARANAIAHDEIVVWYYGGELYPTALSDLIERAIAEAVAEEREAIAKAVDELADAIRSRGFRSIE